MSKITSTGIEPNGPHANSPIDHEKKVESSSIRNASERLSIPFIIRLPFMSLLAFSTGLFLGAVDASQMAGLVFRAENAHRLPSPTDRAGWYMYHRSKSYHMMKAGLREGILKGFGLAFTVGFFVTTEEAMDQFANEWFNARRADAVGTIIAGGATAGVWSAWSKYCTCYKYAHDMLNKM
jgi:hypothetical protein